MTTKLQVGDAAPDFELLDQDGRTVGSKDIRGKKVLALYFYPKDFTKVCTMEAVAFRQMHEQFQAAGAEVIGVSADDVQTHKEFTNEHELTFRLLSDEKNEHGARKHTKAMSEHWTPPFAVQAAEGVPPQRTCLFGSEVLCR